jgi:hypothetical protein
MDLMVMSVSPEMGEGMSEESRPEIDACRFGSSCGEAKLARYGESDLAG